MTMTITMVGTRRQCAKTIKKTARHDDYGMITDVRLQRMRAFVWHLQYDVEVR